MEEMQEAYGELMCVDGELAGFGGGVREVVCRCFGIWDRSQSPKKGEAFGRPGPWGGLLCCLSAGLSAGGRFKNTAS